MSLAIVRALKHALVRSPLTVSEELLASPSEGVELTDEDLVKVTGAGHDRHDEDHRHHDEDHRRRDDDHRRHDDDRRHKHDR